MELSAIIQALFTSIGILIGGIWTYLLFVRQRLHFPKVNIGLSTTDVMLPDGNRLVHAEIKIDNVGSMILCSNYAELRIRQVVPVPNEINTIIEDGEDPVQEGMTEVLWPMLYNREWKWEDKCFEIEPGESDFLHADYIIPGNIKVVEFYSFIANAKKKRHGLGWPLTQLHEFHLEEEKNGRKENTKTGQQICSEK